MLLYNNAKPHSEKNDVGRKILDFDWSFLPHPSYSEHLTPRKKNIGFWLVFSTSPIIFRAPSTQEEKYWILTGLFYLTHHIQSTLHPGRKILDFDWSFLPHPSYSEQLTPRKKNIGFWLVFSTSPIVFRVPYTQEEKYLILTGLFYLTHHIQGTLHPGRKILDFDWSFLPHPSYSEHLTPRKKNNGFWLVFSTSPIVFRALYTQEEKYWILTGLFYLTHHIQSTLHWVIFVLFVLYKMILMAK